jgi:hypothetical protein
MPLDEERALVALVTDRRIVTVSSLAPFFFVKDHHVSPVVSLPAVVG